ncbi:hypothetical protein BDP27DRAFT_1374160 [Rhodocollybia butyracea]|uniref:Uncharacterized protein n=1 Tax=Rhodocollybia butyracea TaxID=206335 RepID=A0A9P5P8C0_9AGAR|nr:hypothetical protein BDP27DRAFT_1374160 [Rhodocollybia butyracea]
MNLRMQYTIEGKNSRTLDGSQDPKVFCVFAGKTTSRKAGPGQILVWKGNPKPRGSWPLTLNPVRKECKGLKERDHMNPNIPSFCVFAGKTTSRKAGPGQILVWKGNPKPRGSWPLTLNPVRKECKGLKERDHMNPNIPHGAKLPEHRSLRVNVKLAEEPENPNRVQA